MEKNGKDSETIRKETGWFRGYDGEWRFEISDGEVAFIENPKFEIKGNNSDGFWQTAKLGDIIKHNKLFEAYPELKDVTVIIQETEPGVQGISFMNSNEIVLNRELFVRYTKEYSDYLNGGRITEIKRIESTLEYKEYSKYYDDPTYDEEHIGAEEWLELEEKARKQFFSSDNGKRYYDLNWGKVDIRKTEPGWSNQAMEVLIHEIQHNVQKIEGFSNGTNTKNSTYDRNAGEVEARDVSKRLKYSDEQRKKHTTGY